MSDYKDTLNLPNTSFPMKASLATREPAMLAQWQEQSLYTAIRNARAGKEKFIVHDGPPYANGHLHCGHALNKILKDLIVKSKTLSGYDAPFVPGWDCHGLPIELNVEKKIGKAGAKVSAEEFRQQCRKYANSQIEIQSSEFQRLGVIGDWVNPYKTMDYTFEANIMRSLALMIEHNHLQQGFKPVHWCLECGSALAEAEVEYEDKTSPSIDVAFYASEPQKFLECMGLNIQLKPVVIPIWTTTPWTLPANEAVCLNPELTYECLDLGHEYMIVAKDLLGSVMERYGISAWIKCGHALGKVFANLFVQHPLYTKNVPIILGDHVTIETGTGAVHTAPVHGTDDYVVGLQYKLPLNNPVLPNGQYHPNVELFGGLHISKANDVIIGELHERRMLISRGSIQHSYPHCWRHKTPMIFLATPQWFISMEKSNLRESLLSIIDSVQFQPEWGKARISDMIRNRPDWCISRQRAWGTPMPLFIHKTTNALHPQTIMLIEKIAKLVERDGMEAWFKCDIHEILGDDAPFYAKSQDTLDVWFDSGLTHFCVLKQRQDVLAFPADVYFEGSDQHRGWFNSSITTAGALYGVSPYKTLLTHGYTVDSEGKKLSKSKGNYVALDKLIAQYGADILRLWVASTDYRNEVSISEEIIKRTADTYRRIRNTARFLLSNLFDFVPEKHSIPVAELVEIDRWAIKRCQQLQQAIIKSYDQYNFHIIYQEIHNFCSVELGAFYLDIIKDRQYTTAVNSHARRSCQTAMYHILHALTRWLAPILSFTAEEIWQCMPDYAGQSIFLQEWYTAWPKIENVDLEYWNKIQQIRDVVNKELENQRQAGVFGSALAAEVTLYTDNQQILTHLKDELRFVFMVSKITLAPWNQRTQNAWVDQELQLAITAQASTAPKCDRCWHRLPDVGTNAEHPEICSRCIGNISGNDEQREFA
jgi:isoleucyl-tRNA synthetase